MITEPKDLLELIEKKERKSRNRTIIYSIIPILLAFILIIFTGNKIKQLNEIKNEREKYIKEIDSMKVQINALQKQLEKSTDFVSNLHQINWSESKMLFSLFPKQARLLSEIKDMKRGNIKWKIGSINPQKGFDSPSFATYMINKYSKTHVDEKNRYKLKDFIKPIDKPETGDLIFYEWGYSMFYFTDESHQPYCIGMTPAGIVALNINFGPKILGYGNIDY